MILWQKRLAPAYSSFVAHRFYDLSSLSGVVPSGHQPSLTQPISVLKSSISPTVVTDFQKLMWHLQVALSVFAIFVSVYIILFCIASERIEGTLVWIGMNCAGTTGDGDKFGVPVLLSAVDIFVPVFAG